MKDKPKMDEMMGELEQPSVPHLTLGQQLRKLASTKTFKYTTRLVLVAAAIFSLTKILPPTISDFSEWTTEQEISQYNKRFNQIKNEMVLGRYDNADTLITQLELDMKDSGSPEATSLLETIVAYDFEEIDPLLQRAATEQAAYGLQTQQAADLSALLTQQAIKTQVRVSVDEYLTQTAQAQPTITFTNEPTLTLAPTSTQTPVPTSTRSPTAVPTSSNYFYWIKEGVVGGSSLTVNLKPNQILYLSASKWTYNGYSCSNDSKNDRMCVFVHQAKSDETITLNSLITDNAWYGITSGGTVEGVVWNRLRYWHTPPNCETGCDYVLVRNVFTENNVASSNYKWDAASSSYIAQ